MQAARAAEAATSAMLRTCLHSVLKWSSILASAMIVNQIGYFSTPKAGEKRAKRITRARAPQAAPTRHFWLGGAEVACPFAALTETESVLRSLMPSVLTFVLILHKNYGHAVEPPISNIVSKLRNNVLHSTTFHVSFSKTSVRNVDLRTASPHA